MKIIQLIYARPVVCIGILTENQIRKDNQSVVNLFLKQTKDIERKYIAIQKFNNNATKTITYKTLITLEVLLVGENRQTKTSFSYNNNRINCSFGVTIY